MSATKVQFEETHAHKTPAAAPIAGMHCTVSGACNLAQSPLATSPRVHERQHLSGMPYTCNDCLSAAACKLTAWPPWRPSLYLCQPYLFTHASAATGLKLLMPKKPYAHPALHAGTQSAIAWPAPGCTCAPGSCSRAGRPRAADSRRRSSAASPAPRRPAAPRPPGTPPAASRRGSTRSSGCRGRSRRSAARAHACPLSWSKLENTGRLVAASPCVCTANRYFPSRTPAAPRPARSIHVPQHVQSTCTANKLCSALEDTCCCGGHTSRDTP